LQPLKKAIWIATIFEICGDKKFEKKVNNIFKNHCDKQKRFYICSRLGPKGFKFEKKEVH